MKRAPFYVILVISALFSAIARADDLAPREGWEVFPTDKPYDKLIADLKTAVTENGMGIVTEAGPTETAASRGVTIPGNRVIGVFNNDYAVRMLELSTAAMIEAPVRFYVTENADGTATLAYKTPTDVFFPYSEEGGIKLIELATEIDTKFAAIASAAIK